MNSLHSILIQSGTHSGNKSIKDLVDDFGFVCTTGAPLFAPLEMKDVAKTEWPDEHGEDVFIPNKRGYKAVSISIPVAYTGKISSSGKALRALTDYLTSNGSLTIYSELSGCGFDICTFDGVDNSVLTPCGNYEVLECNIKFCAHDPASTVKYIHTELIDELVVTEVKLND